MSADSHDLELSIAGNCSVAPSYSEAVLMITPPPSPHRRDTITSNSLPNPVGSSAGDVVSQSTTPTAPHNNTPPASLFYRSAPLPARRPDDPFEGRWCCWATADHAPPCYEEALEVSEPVDLSTPCLAVQMRRSRTERDFISTASRLLFPRRSINYNFETSL